MQGQRITWELFEYGSLLLIVYDNGKAVYSSDDVPFWERASDGYSLSDFLKDVEADPDSIYDKPFNNIGFYQDEYPVEHLGYTHYVEYLWNERSYEVFLLASSDGIRGGGIDHDSPWSKNNRWVLEGLQEEYFKNL